VLIGGGVAAVGFGVYWCLARLRPRAPSIALRWSAAGGFATIGGSF